MGGRVLHQGAWLLVATLVVLQPSRDAFAQALPPAATPGGAAPRVAPPVDITVPDAEAELFPIPPAVERPLEAEEGERLFVTRFKLAGVEDRPQAGISKNELESLLEQMRIERQGLNLVDETGFTDEERAEIVGFMREVVAKPDLDMVFEEYESLVDKLRQLKVERDAGMTVGQMQEAAAAVTQYYRSAGYILAQAFIPAQEVVDGEVTIEILEGTLGNVLAEGNEAYSDELLAKPFEDLIGAPVTAAEVEHAILTVSDYPGLAAFGVFQPGKEVGATDLVIRVQDENPFYASARFDNHGSRFTGRDRLFVDFTWNNPFRAGDRLSGAVMRQFKPKNAWFGSLEYERPMFLPGMSVGVAAQRNPFDVGAELAEAGLTGESQVFRAYLRNSFLRSRARNLSGYFGYKRSDSESKRAGELFAIDRLAMAEVEFTYDSIDTQSRAINLATAGVTKGLGSVFGACGTSCMQTADPPSSRQGGGGGFASNDFWKITASYSRLQKITDNQSALLRAEGQFTRDILTSLEGFDVGGPSSVRAYPVSEFLFDSALFASFEYTFNAPGFSDAPAGFKGLTWGEVLRVSFFLDFARGDINDASTTDDPRVGIGGYGGALAFSVPGTFDGRLQYAHTIGNSRNPSDGDAARWWFDLTYQY